jgi:hypothetical protein
MARRFDKHCPVRLRDPWESAKKKLGAKGEPKRYLRNKGFQFRLRERGIWLFLDDDLRIRTIRLEKPFAGKIDGIAIGDLRDTVGTPLADVMIEYDAKQRVRAILV